MEDKQVTTLDKLYPVDWSIREGETQDEARLRQIHEILRITMNAHRPSRLSERLADHFGVVIRIFSYMIAIGAASAIIRALWLLAGKI